MAIVRIMLLAWAFFWHQAVFAEECAGHGSMGYVCGVQGAEDLVAVPDSPWLVTGGLSQGDQPGSLSLVQREQKTVTRLFPSDAVSNEPDPLAYPNCTEPVSRVAFSAHGINLRRGAGGMHTLYVVNHGAREAIEVFELDASRDTPRLTWRGCVHLPAGSIGNAVSPLPDGGLAVTLMAVPRYFDPPESATRPDAWTAKFKAVQPTGYLAIWTAKQGWKEVPGTVGSGPNGVEISPDGRWAWVANWADREVLRVSLQEDAARHVLKLQLMPDNVRWGDDGALWVTGATSTPADYFTCWVTPGCKNGFAIVRIDPASLTLRTVPQPRELPGFGDATTALKIGDRVWIAAYPSDRIGHLQLEADASSTAQ